MLGLGMGTAFFLLAWTALAATPAATSAVPPLARGLAAYADLDYRTARQSFEAALADPDLAKADRINVLAHLARTLAVLRVSREAERRFLELLTLDPEHRVSWEESPLVRAAFGAARRQQARAARQERKARPAATLSTTAGDSFAATGPAPAPAPATSRSQWLVMGGAAAAAGLILTVLLVASRDEEADNGERVVYRWHLP
jgi:hypothetical protein